MRVICGIYKITSPTRKIYIGQSHNCIKRRLSHERPRDKSKVCNSIRKYGWEAHQFEIIHECDPEQLNELEAYYVELFQSFNTKFGLNLREGGGSQGKLSDETKRKISASGKGRIVSEETRRKISVINKGKIVTEETRRKIRESKSVLSQEARFNISEGQKRRDWSRQVWTDEMKGKLSIGNKRWWDENPEKAKERKEKLTSFFIKNNPHLGKKQSTKTISKRSQSLKEFYSKTPKKIAQFDLKGNLVNSFPTLVDAHKATGANKTQIALCCKYTDGTSSVRVLSSGGFKWVYIK